MSAWCGLSEPNPVDVQRQEIEAIWEQERKVVELRKVTPVGLIVKQAALPAPTQQPMKVIDNRGLYEHNGTYYKSLAQAELAAELGKKARENNEWNAKMNAAKRTVDLQQTLAAQLTTPEMPKEVQYDIAAQLVARGYLPRYWKIEQYWHDARSDTYTFRMRNVKNNFIETVKIPNVRRKPTLSKAQYVMQ